MQSLSVACDAFSESAGITAQNKAGPVNLHGYRGFRVEGTAGKDAMV